MKNKYKDLFSFGKYFKKHKGLIFLLLFVMLTASSLGLILPYFYSKRLIGITDLNNMSVIMFSGLIIIIIAFHHLFWYLWEKLGSIIENRVTNDIRNDLTIAMLNTKYEHLNKQTSGYYLERIKNDAYEVSNVFVNVLGTIIDTFTNVIFLIVIFILNYKIGIVFTLGIGFLFIVDTIRIRKNLYYINIAKQLSENLNSKVNESFQGIKDIKGLGINETIIESNFEVIKNTANTYIRKDSTLAFLSRVKTFLYYCIEASLIVYAVLYLIPNNQITIVILLMIINYSGFMFDLVDFITTSKDELNKGELKAKRILQVLNEENIETYGKIEKLNNHSIEVKNFSFSFSLDNMLFNNINFYIKENTSNLFIGSSGSGKTTLFNVLTKLYTVDNEIVYIGDIDINELTYDAIKNNISIINQEPFLLNDTIENNIKIVKPDATIEEIIEVSKKANIYEEIMSFENGFKTIVSENSRNLSGGQKQRIAIARSLLKDTHILLFDEPTSALDKKNQQLFFDTLAKIKKEKTILVIGHKIDNYSLFDNIYEVKSGNLRKLSNKN